MYQFKHRPKKKKKKPEVLNVFLQTTNKLV